MIKNEQGESELHIDGEITMEQDFWGWLFDEPDKSALAIREAIKQADGKDLAVWINSTGGDVFAASVIYTALKEHKGGVTVKIDGTAISAASVIAMAGDKILMSPTAVMMIHNPWTSAAGEAKDMEQAAKVLNEVKSTIMNAYTIKTGKSRNEISKLMDAETWMGVQTAIELGFADGMLYEAKEPEPNLLAKGAQVVYNSVQHKPIDLEKLVEALKPKEPKNEPEKDPPTEDFLIPENGMQYADYMAKIHAKKGI